LSRQTQNWLETDNYTLSLNTSRRHVSFLTPDIKFVMALEAGILPDREPEKKLFQKKTPVHPFIRGALAFRAGLYFFICPGYAGIVI